ncbi:unnamed protein product [Haemonchus placei]|uniref:Uncharacterized protein n=1 Tax=Haemonchus placei TaxID=6290 RepID=A0A3P7SUP8_HAEPC|nr:unnamed protein product [Haemonchus placei]
MPKRAMVPMFNLSKLPFLLRSTCFACVFFKTICITIFPSLLIERFFASYYIDDYETKSRLWVAIIAVLSACILSLLCFVFSFVFLSLHRLVLSDFDDQRFQNLARFELHPTNISSIVPHAVCPCNCFLERSFLFS